MKNKKDFYKVDDRVVFEGIDVVIDKRRKHFDTSDVLAKALELLIDNINLEGCYYCPAYALDKENCPCDYKEGCDVCKKYIKSYYISQAFKELMEDTFNDNSREIH